MGLDPIVSRDKVPATFGPPLPMPASSVALTKCFELALIFFGGRSMMYLGQYYWERIVKLPIITASVVAYAALAATLICYTGLATN
jgi:hypothetical protein